MKRKTFALVAILLTTLFASEAKAVSRAVYCQTLMMIYDAWNDEQIQEDGRSSYGFTEAYRDHCM